MDVGASAFCNPHPASATPCASHEALGQGLAFESSDYRLNLLQADLPFCIGSLLFRKQKSSPKFANAGS